ncbi:MAG: LytTR family DNA-binding domain-containing protein [Sporomusaceae bacterium]|nr:LytTR family DNA-binding domain-containing protein [Sporomusaceae bacterium]
MYQVAICEDEKIFSEMLEKMCRDIFSDLDIEYHLEIFDSGANFLASFKEKQYDLILLDIIMPEIKGIDLARQIRTHDHNATIIFITSHQDYALEGYDVNARHYLLKPPDKSVLERLIRTDYYDKFQVRFLIFKSGSQNLRVPLKDIICLETVGRRVAVTLPDRIVYFPGKLSELLAKLPQTEFIRCHQAFAINLANMRELSQQMAIATTGQATPISRAFKKEVQKAFLQSIKEG